MGENKAFLRLGNRSLIEHAIFNVRPLAGEPFIVGPQEEFSKYGLTISDVYPDCGPLGGIHAALEHTRTSLNLIIPVDMPFLESGYLRQLIETARGNNALVTVTRTHRGLQPLCAVYRTPFKKLAEEAIRAGEYKIDKLFGEETSIIDIRGLGYDDRMFENLNTPDDVERAALEQAGQPGATKS
jgi:molybdopterin-guanine dinucleotide biosynthesis protein A